uniref:Uncharacterized protein n=1 Tax=Romanomermis culicivorax TaxID=13658 RepID=A0A915J7C4_ROMCU
MSWPAGLQRYKTGMVNDRWEKNFPQLRVCMTTREQKEEAFGYTDTCKSIFAKIQHPSSGHLINISQQREC